MSDAWDKHRPLVLANLALWVLQALYTLSPIDLLPDFIPVIGLLDDLLGFGLVIAFTVYTARVLRREGALPGRREPAIDVVPYEPMPLEQLRKL